MSNEVRDVTKEYQAASAAADKIDIALQFGIPDIKSLIRSTYVLGFVDGARSGRAEMETCEQCCGHRYLGDVPCSACNAMGESPALRREP